MKVLVRDLVPNPFRRMEKYPIDSYKVDALKISINETSFWDNLLARERSGRYEIAYGHHRLIALQELGIEEVGIPVKGISDADMIRIMANENMDEWRYNPAIINETVAVAKEYLDGELAKYDSWEAFKTNRNNSLKCVYDVVKDAKYPEREYQIVKSKGVGQTTILKFLGGNWKRWQVQEALKTLSDKETEREAMEVFDSQQTAKSFRQAVEKVEVPKEKQKQVAEKVAEKIKGAKKDKKKQGKLGARDHYKTSMETMVRTAADDKMTEEDARLVEIEIGLKNLFVKVKDTTNSFKGMKGNLEGLKIEQLGGLEGFVALSDLTDLLIEIKDFIGVFGFDYKNLLEGGK